MTKKRVLSDGDIETLKSIFATKEDISNLATKEDIRDLNVVFATKAEMQDMKEEILDGYKKLNNEFLIK